jgi:metallophosphoesterase (TIGR00282 family)
MKLLFLGDVVGRSGRTAIAEGLPRLRREWALDFVVVNGENATGGMGLSGAHAALLFEAGADCVTLGDHAFDQRDMMGFIEEEGRIIRPLNFARVAPGRGARFFDTAGGRRVFVAQVLGQAFMKRPFDDPFSAVDAALRPATLGGTAAAVIVEVHAEATSEKMALAHWCDGRASLVVGTHTHVPTADARILERGTAYQSDAGMCGDYDSVIGMDKHASLDRWRSPLPGRKMEPAMGEATLCAVFIETDDRTGLARMVAPVRIGGTMPGAMPTLL